MVSATVARRLRSLTVAAGLIVPGPLACGRSDIADPPSLRDPSASTITLVNDGDVTLTSVRIRTSTRDSILVATLVPGQSAGPFTVSAVHESPSAEASVGARRLGTFPVEGFDAFNPARAPGAFMIRLRPSAAGDGVDIRIAPTSP